MANIFDKIDKDVREFLDMIDSMLKNKGTTKKDKTKK